MTTDSTHTEPVPKEARELAREIGEWIQAVPGRAESIQDAAGEWMRGAQGRLDKLKVEAETCWYLSELNISDDFAPGEREALLLRFVQAVRESLPPIDMRSIQDLTLPPERQSSPVAAHEFFLLVQDWDDWGKEVERVQNAFREVKGQAEQESAPLPEYVKGQKAAAKIAGVSVRTIRNWKNNGWITEYPGKLYKTSELLEQSGKSGG
jgi:hypothetical protein